MSLIRTRTRPACRQYGAHKHHLWQHFIGSDCLCLHFLDVLHLFDLLVHSICIPSHSSGFQPFCTFFFFLEKRKTVRMRLLSDIFWFISTLIYPTLNKIQLSHPIFSRYWIDALLPLSHEWKRVKGVVTSWTFKVNIFTSGCLWLETAPAISPPHRDKHI